jgi:hypothetical protein
MPTSIRYPENIDDVTTLYTARDSAYLVLAADYNPSDSNIQVEYDPEKTSLFPQTGIITLTEQCSEPENRAISFYYTSFSNNVFSGLTVLDGFDNTIVRPSRITKVVMNVMAEHHNILKNGIIEVEKFAGTRITDRLSCGNLSDTLSTGTVEQRTVCATKYAYEPKAWFSTNRTTSLVPGTFTFTNLSFRLGSNIPDNNIKYYWDFGDNTASNISINQYSDEVPIYTNDVIVDDVDGGTIKKTYTTTGVFTVSLRVVNDFGEDTVTFKDLINVKYPAPDEAFIVETENEIQKKINGVFKSPTNLQIFIKVPTDPYINPSTGRTWSGEKVNTNGTPIDPIINYVWYIPDDIDHGNDLSTSSIFSIGGIYTISLKVETQSLAYRVTKFENYINIVERTNLWLWTFFGNSHVAVQANEMGFLSQTFKTKQSTSLTTTIDDTFLNNVAYSNITQQQKEFLRNTKFIPKFGSLESGIGGDSVLFYATGRGAADPISTEKINVVEFNGYFESYSTKTNITRPWNWISFYLSDVVYFYFGNITTAQSPGLSMTNWQNVQQLNLNNYVVINTFLNTNNFIGYSVDLQSNPSTTFNSSGVSSYGYFGINRIAQRESTGYILRNDTNGSNYRIFNFYSTTTDGLSFTGFSKKPDMLGTVKKEGQLVNLSTGLYFFDNSGAISQYDTGLEAWRTGGPGLNSTAFSLMQDQTVFGYDDLDNSLLAASDGSNNAYISFDYSSNSYIKFNDLDYTFTRLNSRPDGNQWAMGNY